MSPKNNGCRSLIKKMVMEESVRLLLKGFGYSDELIDAIVEQESAIENEEPVYEEIIVDTSSVSHVSADANSYTVQSYPSALDLLEAV